MANLLKIKSIAEEKNISLKEVAEFVGITPTGLSKLIRENSTKTVTLEKIALKLKVPVSVFFEEDGASRGEYPETSLSDYQGGLCLVDISVVAGFGSADFAIDKNDIIARYHIPDFEGKADFMTYVRGNSMLPSYQSGDIVVCKIIKESSFIQWNEIHIVATAEQGLLIKRVKPGTSNDALSLISDNKEFPPFEVPREEVTGMALVLGSVRFE